MKINLTIIFALITGLLFGQTSTFKWEDELCTYISQYNKKLYSEIQIQNCYLLAHKDDFRFQNTPGIFGVKDLERINLEDLDKEYREKSKLLITLDLPKIQFWNNLRKRRLIELDQLYNLSKITCQSFLDPKYLRKFNHSDSSLSKHANSLISGGDRLLNDWRELTLHLAERNGWPEEVWSDYYKKLNSKDKFTHARINVTMFGWWNCAIHYIDYTESFIDDEKTSGAFLKLFDKTVKLDCNEP
jgi:hypothetical protein